MNILKKLSKVFSSSPKNMNPQYQGQSKQQLKQRLTPLQYRVTQESATQPPYKNTFYKHFATGMYNCVVCNIPLFSSQTKFDSGCGWPAFYAQLKDANIKQIKDVSHGMVRVQVRCGKCDSHIGHLFDDGPKDKTGQRYCVNSASVSFQEKK